MAQARKRSREEVSIIDETKDEVGGEESAPSHSSSSAQKPFQMRVRLPARFASHLFELTKQLGFKRDGLTVEWLIQQSLSDQDQDPHKFSSDNDLLMKTPPRKKRQLGTPQPKDRHRRTEDGRDRRVRVPDSCISQLILLTQKHSLKSYGETIEWLFNKYCLSAIRPQDAIQPSKATNPTFPFTNGSFNDAYLSLDNDSSSIFPIDLNLPSHDHQYNYEPFNFTEAFFNANPNSVHSSSYLPASSTGGSANQLQHTPYPPQQAVIQPNSMSFQSWSPEAGEGMAANDRLVMEGSRFEPPVQMGSLQNNPSIYEHAYVEKSSGMAAERLVPAENVSYAEHVCNPNRTSFTSIPQSYCPECQCQLPYEGISPGTTELALFGNIYTSGNRRGVRLNEPYVK